MSADSGSVSLTRIWSMSSEASLDATENWKLNFLISFAAFPWIILSSLTEALYVVPCCRFSGMNSRMLLPFQIAEPLSEGEKENSLASASAPASAPGTGAVNSILMEEFSLMIPPVYALYTQKMQRGRLRSCRRKIAAMAEMSASLPQSL